MPNYSAEIQQLLNGPRPFSEKELGRLAVLRHLMGRARIAEAHSSSPPPQKEDLFEGITGLPEIAGSELTGRHIASGLLHHGALLVRNLLGAPAVERLCRLIDGADWSSGLYFPTDEDGNPLESAAPMKCSPATLQVLVEAYQEVGLQEIMTDYLGESPVLLAERIQLDRRIVASGLPWHQDGGFFGANSTTAIR